MKKRKAFTLIELIAVLVILAILALIVSPLVLNIIKKARTAADKRSIDAYGRSIELAIADYLLDKGEFPTSIEQLTIEYTGDEVVCTTTQIKSDSSVYLAGCTVGGREVKDYTYGSEEAVTYEAYSVGDEITYNNVDYYVIKNSGTTEDTVTMLKAEALTTEEVNQYGSGHLNRYTTRKQSTAYDNNGYGIMAYYASETCGFIDNKWIETQCITDYEQSEIKYVIDVWKNSQIPAAIEARLITFDEIIENFGYEWSQSCPTCGGWMPTENTPKWVYNSNYRYWTSSKFQESQPYVWYVYETGKLDYMKVNGNYGYFEGGAVRPVVVISKDALN